MAGIKDKIPKNYIDRSDGCIGVAIQLMVHDIQELNKCIDGMHHDFSRCNDLRLQANQVVELLQKEKERLENEVRHYKNIALEKSLCDWCVHDGGTTACTGCNNFKNFTRKD